MRQRMVLLLTSVPVLALCSLAIAEEARESAARGMFERLATNDQILLEELPDSVPEFIQEWLTGLDEDGDGVVTAGEFSAGQRPREAVMRPGRGQQIRQAVEGRERGRAEPSPGRGERPREAEDPAAPRAERVRSDRERTPVERERVARQPAGTRLAWGDPEALFRRFDRDGDGQLSLQEFTAAVRVLQERSAAIRGAVERRVQQARQPSQRPPTPRAQGMQPPRRGAAGPQAPWMQRRDQQPWRQQGQGMGDAQRSRWRGWAAPGDQPADEAADSVMEEEAVEAEEDAIVPADEAGSEDVPEEGGAEETVSDGRATDDTVTAEEASETEEDESAAGEVLEDEAMMGVEDLEAPDEEIAH